MTSRLVPLVLVALAAPLFAADPPGVSVDKKARTVTIDCQVAPRKLPKLDQVYPVEVVATFPAPKGQKAHETIINYSAKPSDVHKALVSLGLKPGKAVQGKAGKPTGAEVSVFLELPGEGGKAKRVPIEEALVNKTDGKSLPKLSWVFTGSVMSNPDPEKDDLVYGADLTGTLITLFPVTAETVLQSTTPLQESLKVETNAKVLPKVGTAIKLVIQAR
jgi:hypothetical protein